MPESEILEFEGWTLRARIPTGNAGYPVLVMLHGWLGNEDVTWIFSSKIPDHFAVIAPRAPHPAPGGGYSWVMERGAGFSIFDDFAPSCEALDGLRASLARRFEGDFSRVHALGFSQGAALAASWAARSPGSIRSLALLAGFIPDGLGEGLDNGAWNGLPVFIGHGSRDKIATIERMRAGEGIAREAGAEVAVCVDDVGHKLSAGCLRALGEFYTRF